MEINMTVKIFCIYHKKSKIFKSEVVEPIQTGCNSTDLDLGVLKDNTGNNIADFNPYYGEMTAWFWVWKNYLKEHPDVDYIGFCHYRRFLDFQHKENRQAFSTEIPTKTIEKNFAKLYTNEKILPIIKNYDVILPKKCKMKKKRGTIYEQFVKAHPKNEIDKLISIIKKYYPEYEHDMTDYLNHNAGYFCLNFVMKRKYFEEFMEWTFDLLKKMEETSDWTHYIDYSTRRTPAYLIERFFNVWLNHKIRTQGIKVLERKSYMLCNSIIKIFSGCEIIKNQKHTKINILNIIRLSLKNKVK